MRKRLGFFAFGDIDLNPLPVERLPLVVPQEHSLVVKPDHRSIARQHSIFHAGWFSCASALFHRMNNTLSIIRMKPGLPEMWIGDELLRRKTEDGLDLRADVGRAANVICGAQVENNGKALHQQPVSCFCLTSRAPRFCITQLPLDGGYQSGKLVFHEEVIRPPFESTDRGLLADRTGNDNKGNIQATGFQCIQGGHGTEMRHGKVG